MTDDAYDSLETFLHDAQNYRLSTVLQYRRMFVRLVTAHPDGCTPDELSRFCLRSRVTFAQSAIQAAKLWWTTVQYPGVEFPWGRTDMTGTPVPVTDTHRAVFQILSGFLSSEGDWPPERIVALSWAELPGMRREFWMHLGEDEQQAFRAELERLRALNGGGAHLFPRFVRVPDQYMDPELLCG